jgi:hypothetical protein
MAQNSIVTVLTPAASRWCTTLDIARDELGITDTSYDGRLTRWIESASSAIMDYVGRELAREEVSEKISSVGRNGVCLLNRYPVTSIDSVTIGDNNALTTDQYTLDANSGRLMLWGSAWPDIFDRHAIDVWTPSSADYTRWFVGVTVHYTGGYLLPDNVPPQVQDACLLILQRRKAWSSRDPSILSQSVAGVLSTTYAVNAPGADNTIPADAQALLDAFREIRL